MFTRRSTMSLMTDMSPAVGSLPSTALRLVLDAQATRQVEPEFRLDLAPAAVGAPRVGKLETRHEIDDQGKDPDEEDEDRTGFAHRGGMLHGMVADRL